MSIDVPIADNVPLFGSLVRRHRTRIGLTQRELADLSTVSVRAIRDLEQGRARRPRQDTVRLIADGLRLGTRARADLESAAGEGRTSWAVKAGYEADPPSPPLAVDVQLGREAETSVIVDELGTGAERLVTIVGIDGVGRTRLALEVATRLHTAERTPVLWCPLTGPTGGDRLSTLVRATADQLLGTGGGAPPVNGPDELAAFMEIVADRPPLLVLDGVTEAAHAHRIGQLLRDCPGLRILVTAAFPLGAPGERHFLLNPLAVPAEGEPFTVDVPAVRIFMERARRFRPDVNPDIREAALIADICRRLDGVPQAIHAAASWLVVYDIATLHQCLHDGPAGLLHHLAGPDGGINLRDALDRRLATLPTPERELLDALCVRGETFDLAEVMTLTGHSLPDSGRAVRSLVLRGLVRPTYTAGQSRFRILHLVRAAQLCALDIRV
ncbi:ATP-binding protein [Micromonospora sp. NPDC048871]|uniref:ATP-binding protein n=1 Tax=unclassified Micromonospora TaxID=2617518 RepID=UPI002E11C1CD|nr:helix-turn-helix domain-containing protein [Micromonospora sp. NBC_01739]